MKTLRREFFGVAAVAALALANPGPASAVTLFTNTHFYGFGADPMAVEILVEVIDNFAGDFGKYEWRYTVTNHSYDPVPGSSNGFSGFETALPAGVPDLMDLYAPTAAWIFDCCSGQPVEWDITNTGGLGVMPGETGVFGFSSLPRFITESSGWFHTWQSDIQTDLVFYEPGNGVEVPDVIRRPIPEPGTLALLGFGLTCLRLRRHRAD
jgi:hypothetical protein